MLKRWRLFRWLLVIITVSLFFIIDYFKINIPIIYIVIAFVLLFAFTTFKIYTSSIQEEEDNIT